MAALLALAACTADHVDTPPGSAAGVQSTASSSVTAPDDCANPYLPVSEGATWVYAGTNADGFTDTIHDVQPDGFVIRTNYEEQGLKIGWSCSEGELTARHYGAAPGATRAFAVGARLETVGQHGVSMPADPQPGDEWRQSFRVRTTPPADNIGASHGTIEVTYRAIAMESIDTLEGRVEALRVDVSVTFDVHGGPAPAMDGSVDGSTWWVRGVGPVRATIRSQDFGDPSAGVVRLQTHTT